MPIQDETNKDKKVQRDESNLGVTKTHQKGEEKFADGDQPEWSPPEFQPEPRRVEPILNPNSKSKGPQSPNKPNSETNANSPA